MPSNLNGFTIWILPAIFFSEIFQFQSIVATTSSAAQTHVPSTENDIKDPLTNNQPGNVQTHSEQKVEENEAYEKVRGCYVPDVTALQSYIPGTCTHMFFPCEIVHVQESPNESPQQMSKNPSDKKSQEKGEYILNISKKYEKAIEELRKDDKNTDLKFILALDLSKKENDYRTFTEEWKADEKKKRISGKGADSDKSSIHENNGDKNNDIKIFVRVPGSFHWKDEERRESHERKDDIQHLETYVDYFNIDGFLLFGKQRMFGDMLSSPVAPPMHNIVDIIDMWIETIGTSARRKILLGFNFVAYGVSFENDNAKITSPKDHSDLFLGSVLYLMAAHKVRKPTLKLRENKLSEPYNKFCKMPELDGTHMNMVKRDPSTKYHFVGDEFAEFAEKLAFIVEKNIGGMYTSNLANDDVKGECHMSPEKKDNQPVKYLLMSYARYLFTGKYAVPKQSTGVVKP
ncbi:hypothetical protein Ddc_02900 [Ditylenchus destructor]|nr:hypothetical protein Ddc_02900 [Ditylenchus destructor]